MKNAKINIRVELKDEFNENGKDNVTIYITTNLGEGEKELSYGANEFIIEVEGIKIGIIGLITVETPPSTKTEIKDLEFEEYLKIINKESDDLKKKEQMLLSF